MKKKNHWIMALAGLVMLLVQCKKEELESSPRPYGLCDFPNHDNFSIRFYFSDSLGNNVLPEDFPENPIVDTATFKVYGATTGLSYGMYVSRDESKSKGFRFFVNDNWRNIREETAYDITGIIHYDLCFGDTCHSVQIMAVMSGDSTRNQEMVVFDEDTLKGYKRYQVVGIRNFGQTNQYLSH